MKKDGIWGEKQKREYLFDAEGNPIIDERGKRKYNAVPTTDWNRPEVLEEWRKSWADLVNEEFAKHGIKARIDHRSYARQGITLIPQVHEGPHVRSMEAKGIVTEKGSLNRMIKEINRGIITLSKQIKNIVFNISELIKLISEKESETKNIGLASYINAYFEKRNENANKFSHGRNKAKITNLKMQSMVINYLIGNHISTLEEFRNLVSEKQNDISRLNLSMKAKSVKMKELKDFLRYGEWYKEAQTIIRQICSTKSMKHKEKIKAENELALRRFHIAKRILFDEKKIGKINLSGWKSELDLLQASYKEEYEKYKKLKEELRIFSDINKYIDDTIRSTSSMKKEEMMR